jgi:caffeoyl-CoA O-methyltransferase
MNSHLLALAKIYAEKVSNDLALSLPVIERYTHLKSHDPEMISDKVQGNLLGLIAKLMRPKLIVEIGTFTGYATICLAQGLRAEGQLITIDHSDRYADDVKQWINQEGLTDKVIQRIGPALDILPTIEGPIDLVFMDAAKRQYADYFSLLIDKMKKGGLIIADNTLWKGEVTAPNKNKIAHSLHEFNIKMNGDPRVEVTLLPHRDGLSFIYIK